jgi:pyruvate,water dikinase
MTEYPSEFENLSFEAPDPWDHWTFDAMHCSGPATAYHANNLALHTKEATQLGFEKLGFPIECYEYALINRFPYYRTRFIGSKKRRKQLPSKWLFKLWTYINPKIRKRFKLASQVFKAKPWKKVLKDWESHIKPEAIATQLQLQAVEPKNLDDKALINYLKECEKNATLRFCQHHSLTAFAYFPIVDYLAQTQRWTGLPLPYLLQAIHHESGHVGIDKEFEELLEELRQNESGRKILYSNQSGEQILEQLKHYSARLDRLLSSWLDIAGYRITSGYDISDFYSLERPDVLVHTIHASLSQVPHQNGAELAQERSAKIRDKIPVRERYLYDELHADACEVVCLKEERALFTYLWGYGLLRRALLVAGERLAHRGIIQDKEDIIDATIDETISLLEGKPLISLEELSKRVHYRKTVSPAIAPISLGNKHSSVPIEWFPHPVQRLLRALKAFLACYQAQAPLAEEHLNIYGLPASEGVYEGKACIIEGPEDFDRIEKGDILVSHHTSEAYNVILPLIGALVTDSGGILSHAATVSREYGIPAVVGTGKATSLIKNNMWIQVDGNNGQIRVLA